MDPFSFNIESEPYSVPLDLLPALVTMARSEKPEDVFQGVMLIRKLLSIARNPPIQEVVDTGVAVVLAKCMTNENTELQFQASWALSNIAAEDIDATSNNDQYIVHLGVVPLWIDHLSSGTDKCKEQAAWALGNVAGIGARSRDYILELGAIQPLLDLICSCGDDELSLLKNTVWALSNLCRFTPPPAIKYMTSAVPVLAKMLQHSDSEVLLDSIWAISYIARGPPERVQLVIDSGVVPAVVQMLTAETIKLHLPAIRIISGLCCGNVQQCQAAIKAGCLPAIQVSLDPLRPRAVRKEASWALAKIAAGNQSRIQAIINAGMLPAIISTLGAYECDVKKEAVRVCSKIATEGSSQQLRHLVECGVLEALCEVLISTLDVKLALETIQVVLNSGAELVRWGQCTSNPYIEKVQHFDDSSAIEGLISHSDFDIRSLAQNITSTYFQTEAENTAQRDVQPLPMQRPKEGNHASEEDENEDENDDGKGFWDS